MDLSNMCRNLSFIVVVKLKKNVYSVLQKASELPDKCVKTKYGY